MGRAVQRTSNGFRICQSAIHVDQVIRTVVHKCHVRPDAFLQFIAISGIHIRNAGGIIGRPHRLAMRRQRNLPALLPAAERHQKCFAVARQVIHFHPEANGRVVSIQLCRIRRGNLGRSAVELVCAIAKAKAVGRRRHICAHRVIIKTGCILRISIETVIGNHALIERRSCTLRRIQISDGLLVQRSVEDQYFIHSAFEKQRSADGVVADAQRAGRAVQFPGNGFGIRQSAIYIN